MLGPGVAFLGPSRSWFLSGMSVSMASVLCRFSPGGVGSSREFQQWFMVGWGAGIVVVSWASRSAVDCTCVSRVCGGPRGVDTSREVSLPNGPGAGAWERDWLTHGFGIGIDAGILGWLCGCMVRLHCAGVSQLCSSTLEEPSQGRLEAVRLGCCLGGGWLSSDVLPFAVTGIASGSQPAVTASSSFPGELMSTVRDLSPSGVGAQSGP